MYVCIYMYINTYILGQHGPPLEAQDPPKLDANVMKYPTITLKNAGGVIDFGSILTPKTALKSAQKVVSIFSMVSFQKDLGVSWGPVGGFSFAVGAHAGRAFVG